MIRKAEGLPAPPKDTYFTRLEGNLEKLMTGTHGSSLPFAIPKGRKVLPVATCEIKGNPAARIQTGLPTNGSLTDPVWGREGVGGQLANWKEGNVLVFTIKLGEQVVALQEITYDQYKNGYEWWLKLDVADSSRFPHGWPFAAIQVKIKLVQGVTLSPEDPFMSTVEPYKPDKAPWCMWCCRRINVCTLSCCLNTKWMFKLCALVCMASCFESCRLCTVTWHWCSGKQSLRELRRDCAKRLKLRGAEDDDGTEEPDTACCCIPLRSAVFVISLISTLNAAQSFFFPHLLMGTGPRFCGGYAVASKVVVGGAQITGLFFGPVGMFGALELNVNLLNMYNYYQLVRFSGMLFMLYTDIPLLADCNVWRSNINAAIAKHGWNPEMYNVAMTNNCLGAQIDFAVGTMFHLIMYVYLISLTRRLIWDTEQTPRYLLSMPRELPNGAFVKHSRTQGRAKPPYGAIYGIDDDTLMNKGKLGPAGFPHMQDGPTMSPIDRAYVPGHLPPEMMPAVPGGRPPKGIWHPNAMPPPPGMRPGMVPHPSMMGMGGMPMGQGMGPGMPMGPPGFRY